MEDAQVNEEFWYNFDKILMQILVPPFLNEIVRPCEEKDFHDYRNTLIDNLNALVSLLDIIKKIDCCSTSSKQHVVKVIVIIGEQHMKSVWNTDEIVQFSKVLSFKICNIFESKNITEILKNDDIFSMIIMFLRPKLLKDTWKTFPSSVICYKWMLEIVEKPLLRRHVPEILPTALIIFDDYIQENQILGLKCINLIIDHCYKSRSLKNLNYDEVVFQALKKMAYKVEFNMITSLYICISNLLKNIYYYESKSTIFGWTKHDEILTILLDNMELQTNSYCQYAYIISLSRLLTHSSLGKWSLRLITILNEYCESNIYLNIADAILDIIKIFLSIYQPQELNFYIITHGLLLKLRYKLNLFKKNTKEIVDKIDQCILLLSKYCPNLSREVFENNTVQSIMHFT